MVRVIVPILLSVLMLTVSGRAADPASLEARYESRRAALDQLWIEHDQAVERYNAADIELDRAIADINRRQAALGSRKQGYLGAVERCPDTACVDRLNGERDAINTAQVALNHEVDRYNARVAQHDAAAARLDLIEAQIGELEHELRTVEAALAKGQ